MVVAIDDFKKGRITDVGADEARTALDDYWKDIEGAGGEKKPEEQEERNERNKRNKQGKPQKRESKEGKNAG